MAGNQTVQTDASVEAYLAGVENETRRNDAMTVVQIMRRVTGVEPRMWGPAMVGFGSCHYKYDSGREGDMLRVGFSPRKANLALYLITRDERFDDLLKQLGKHKTGVSCLYVNRLSDVDLGVLEELVQRSWASAAERYGPNTQ